jgi:short subunit dehydrogenase-like uncharacterized protein
MSVGPLRSGIRKYVFPDPGEGPTSEETEQGYFTVRVLGRGTADDDPFTVEAQFGADWGPGYGATARMLGETGMCLREDDTDSPLSGGVLTPAAAIGTPLADRLRAVGFTATVSEATGAGDEWE